MAGDFNVVRFPMECSKGGRLTSSKRRFFEIIEDLELRDLHLFKEVLALGGGGGGGLNNQSNSRLNWFLVYVVEGGKLQG